MKAKTLTAILREAHAAGLTLRATPSGRMAVRADGSLASELEAKLIEHKAQILELVEWRESEGHKLVQDALAYMNEFYLEAGEPDFRLELLHAPEDLINEAFASRDMHLLRVAVRLWVEAGLAAFEAVAERQREDVA